jgi:parallel beta-helix repeat protein
MKNAIGRIVCNFLPVIFAGLLILLLGSPSTAENFCVGTPTELQNALSLAETNSQNDLIKIQQGTYNGNFIYVSTEPFGVKIEGGYLSECSSRVLDPVNTVLDANSNEYVLKLISPEGVKADFTVDGLTMQNGNVTGSNGAGLHIATGRGNVTITNNKVINNQNGVGLFVKDADPLKMSDNIITNNNAGIGIDPGGGIRIIDSLSVLLTNNIIRDNVGSSYYGGGAFIKCLNNTIKLINNTIQYNFPGGIHVQGKDVITLDKNIITNNEGGGWASGADVWGAELMYIMNNIVCHNTGGNSGGLHIYSGLVNVVNLSNNLICRNNASHLGGGIYIELSDIASANLINNTIWGNSAVDNGGGIWLSLNHDLDKAQIYNNVILNNTLENGFTGRNDLYIINDGNNNGFPSQVFLYNNDFDQSSTGTYIQIPFAIDPSNLNNLDPLFVDFENDDYHLTPNSPLIDKGENSAPELPSTDKDNKPRIIDGDNDNVSYVDIGAYEFGSPRGDLDGDGDVDGDDLEIFAESYGTYLGR